MKVLIVGGGGREHAIAWKLSQSPRVDKLFCAPGNAGIASLAECVSIGAEDIEGLCAFAEREHIGLAVIGPEVPLALGIVDEFTARGIRTFGPDKSCARLEASKSFTKEFLERHDIPTAGYRECLKYEDALESIGCFGWPMVIKADGLAAGKGVVISADRAEAESALEDMMKGRIFGKAGDKVVIEEFLTGVEASVLCFVDGSTIIPMESAQDYKKIFDGDKGPNTGGMGTYSPSLIFDGALERLISERILQPALKGFQKDGLDYKGVLFIGLMIGEDGPKVIEFNTRFGDPETQSVLMRLDTDLLDIMEAVVDGNLAEQRIAWSGARTICVVLAAGGYPGSYEKGKVISGLDQTDPDVMVFHAGTRSRDGIIETAGGRVLGVAASGATSQEAREKAYRNVAKIHFEGMQYRKDIGTIVGRP